MRPKWIPWPGDSGLSREERYRLLQGCCLSLFERGKAGSEPKSADPLDYIYCITVSGTFYEKGR
jgi:hypothetical protein